MISATPGVAALLALATASACVRDRWAYDAGPDAGFETGVDALAGDAALDVSAVDAVDVVDVPAMDVVDVPAVDVPPPAPPRPIAPLSLGDVSHRRPTLRWALSAGHDGAVVELCRDRACTMVIDTLTVSGSSVRLTTDLPARSVVFWRLRGRSGSTTATAYGPTWLFHVPAASASAGVDTSSNPHLDLNGDGYDDVIVGAWEADPGGRMNAGSVSVFHGGPAGVPATAEIVLQGVSPDDHLGTAAAGAGDVNGDGYGDLVLGAPRADPGSRSEAGAASVYLGGPTGVGTSPSRVLEGVGAGDHLGHSVAGAGDVNGDGYADVVVGAVSSNPSGRMVSGSASVFLGSAAGIGASPSRVLAGDAPEQAYAYSVSTAGDLDGDGFSDLVVGAVFASPGGRYRAGTAHVFHGSAAGIPATPVRVLEGLGAVDLFGVSVASAGDVNGDGYGDLVVGASGVELPARPDGGTASVFLGSASGVPMNPSRTLEGVTVTSNFGVAVSGAGDVNGDGFGDLVVGAVFASPFELYRAGTASIFLGSVSGVAMTPAQVINGAEANDNLGGSVHGAGDVNGDGYADVVVGAAHAGPGGRGAAIVFHGNATGILPIARMRTLEGAADGDAFGFVVASSGRKRRPAGV